METTETVVCPALGLLFLGEPGRYAARRAQARAGTLSVMDTDDLLIDLAWRAIRDWRRRRDVDPATRREWIRLYVGVIRRARRGRAVH